mmetsp:Transcript_27816/g.58869  ORF Transcript_27816/g.58869 Transcript_27816/m.58869 type:complete len:266 (-) Transcript_27816:42-839(-)
MRGAEPSQPKAPGLVRLLSSTDSIGTQTPESSNGGHPSRASGIDTMWPGSRASLVDPGDTSGAASRGGDPSTVSLNAFANGLAQLPCGKHPRALPLGSQNSCSPSLVKHHSGELRHRKYAIPCDQLRKPTATAKEREESEVLVEGQLQQRWLKFLWRWRWCVLDRRELRIYGNEEASLLMPEKPLERYSVASLSVGSDLHFPSILIGVSVIGGEPLITLRTGPGLRWEELAASILWLRAFESAARQCAGSCLSVAEGQEDKDGQQ